MGTGIAPDPPRTHEKDNQLRLSLFGVPFVFIREHNSTSPFSWLLRIPVKTFFRM